MMSEFAKQSGEFLAKSSGEHRLTSAVVYQPDTPDAHQEFVERRELSDAFLDYALKGDKTQRLQHRDGTTTGEVVLLACWPAPVADELCVPDQGCTRKSLKAGTIFAASHWTPKAWALIREGKLRGLSMGGSAVRVPDQPLPTAKSICSCGCA